MGIRIDRELDAALERGVLESQAKGPAHAQNKNTLIRIAIQEYVLKHGWYKKPGSST